MLQNANILDTMPVRMYGDDGRRGSPPPPGRHRNKTTGKRLLWGAAVFLANVYIAFFAPISRRAACIVGLVSGIAVMVLLNRWEKKNR